MNEIINQFVNALPFEMHLRDPYVGTYSACGPGTKHKERLEKFKQTGDSEIIFKNQLDKACFFHDAGYNKVKTAEGRKPYDRELMNAAMKILDSDVDGYQKMYAAAIHKFFGRKIGNGKGKPLDPNISTHSNVLGSGVYPQVYPSRRVDKLLKDIYYNPATGFSSIDELSRRTDIGKKQIKEFLEKQAVYTKHKPIKRKFPTRRVMTAGIDTQWQADLVDMQRFSKVNDGAKYILMVIDVFSKYAWGIPIKTKRGSEITKAFRKIFKKKRVPLKIQTDKGTEFISKETQKLFKEHNIIWFTTENETKAQIVERLNRTIKDKMYKYFTAKNTRRWVNVLDDLMKNYNTSRHRSIKMTPEEASKKENEGIVRNNLYPLAKNVGKSKLKIGDTVRISKYKGTFKRGYTPNFTSELFTISEILNTNPITYKIVDKSGEEIKGSFYIQELSVVR